MNDIMNIKKEKFIFVDLFSGCGGLSLGLLSSGWSGLFGIEKNKDAFQTLRHNLVNDDDHNTDNHLYNWPQWLEIKPFEIRRFISGYRSHLLALKGKVHLVAGGPPCQGFSFAGKRTGHDPRNELFKYHLEIVDLIKPQLVLLENVQGIDTAFGTLVARKRERRGRPRKSYAGRIRDALSKHGYEVQQELVKAVDYGVPQFRQRYFTLGIRRDVFIAQGCPNFFEILRNIRIDFLKAKGLPIDRFVTVAEAISDLETTGKDIITCNDPESPSGFKQIVYEGPSSLYQRLLHGSMNGQAPNSLRLVNHQLKTIARFKKILRTCRKGVQLSDAERKRLGIRKTAFAQLAPDRPSHTLTTLPDDLLHYAEPRIHTVREYARLQSFPDWFEFRGTYTTGGNRRSNACPRYTQVGNAVPPFLADAIGSALKELLSNGEIPVSKVLKSTAVIV